MSIIIYTKNGCPYCKSAKESFVGDNKQFTEINVSENPEKIEELVKVAGVRKVPVIIDGDKVTVGFNGGG